MKYLDTAPAGYVEAVSTQDVADAGDAAVYVLNQNDSDELYRAYDAFVPSRLVTVTLTRRQAEKVKNLLGQQPTWSPEGQAYKVFTDALWY